MRNSVPGGAPIALRSVTVRRDRIVFDVAVPLERHRHSSSDLACLLQGRIPDLSRHACVNDRGRTLGAVMEHTSTPHLLEHLALHFQIRRSACPAARFVGTTEWTDEASGAARIQVSFQSDLEALRAFAEALQFLNAAVLTCMA